MRRFPTAAFWALMLILPAGGASCVTPGKAVQDQAREELARKRERFEALRQDLLAGRPLDGSSEEAVRERYGDPDDIFSSGSPASRFAIWNYHPVLTGKESDTQTLPVRLYFDSGRLVSWRY